MSPELIGREPTSRSITPELGLSEQEDKSWSSASSWQSAHRQHSLRHVMTHTHKHVYICTHVHTHVHAHPHIIYTCTHTCTHTRTCTCIYVYVHTHLTLSRTKGLRETHSSGQTLVFSAVGAVFPPPAWQGMCSQWAPCHQSPGGTWRRWFCVLRGSG